MAPTMPSVCSINRWRIYPLRLFEAPLPRGEARGLCKLQTDRQIEIRTDDESAYSGTAQDRSLRIIWQCRTGVVCAFFRLCFLRGFTQTVPCTTMLLSCNIKPYDFVANKKTQCSCRELVRLLSGNSIAFPQSLHS